jgi:hypothetical protein
MFFFRDGLVPLCTSLSLSHQQSNSSLVATLMENEKDLERLFLLLPALYNTRVNHDTYYSGRVNGTITIFEATQPDVVGLGVWT